MPKAKEIEKPTRELSKKQQIARIHSRPSSLPDDDGIVEALRRDAEMDSDPTIEISFEEFDRRIRQRR